MSKHGVKVRREPVEFPTYEPLPPDRHPMFLERRVYQGSSGRVYPLPCYARIAETATPRRWDAVHLENEFVQLMVLPELGGRIHVGRDKTNGYDFFYRQNVIKPALVGLAGPWASGGVEFNWPQHHRPATFMPVDVAIEEHGDGSVTVWLSDHDPMQRLKGMHGLCLHPGSAVVELKMRAFNRTQQLQSFLWWANVGVHAHEGYQSFFPPDVVCVADHARRAMSTFPLCEGRYYGVDYGRRAKDGVPADERPRCFVPKHCGGEAKGIPDYAPNDLRWYANIPVPTSYMCLGSQQDFSGGYDHKQRAGLVQLADHHIAPGKKQWVWGNHEFGYAWDRNLTDRDGPYAELMIGVYTDNQPDFSFLRPGETRAWSVYWYPFQAIGPADHANLDAAVSLQIAARNVKVGVAVTRAVKKCRVALYAKGKLLRRWTKDLAPDRPLLATVALGKGIARTDLQLVVADASGKQMLAFAPVARPQGPMPLPASEPLPPEQMTSADQLYVTGLHLWQYRHATRSPLLYWQEALRRDPGDSRCNTALGSWHLQRGEFELAETHLRAAIARLTERNANPLDGEAHYQLGILLRHQGRDDEAFAALHKAAWNQPWQAAALLALAEIDCARGDWEPALDRLDRCLRLDGDNLRARGLGVVVLRRLGREDEAEALVEESLRLDPLDWWMRYLAGKPLDCDDEVRRDLAIDCARAGLYSEAVAVLSTARGEPAGTLPMIGYQLAQLCERLGGAREAKAAATAAKSASADYCFPARLEDIAILTAAIARDPKDARAHFYLGNLYYDRRRHEDAIAHWQASVGIDPDNAVAWRNLGIALYNVRRDVDGALQAYARARRVDVDDARLLYEQDQLHKRIGVAPAERLRAFRRQPDVVAQRDDATLEWCALLNQLGMPQAARAVLQRRRFQPWEGGEGLALGEWVRAQLLLGREALRRGRAAEALRCFTAAMETPQNLGEARHLLANPSDIHFLLGEAQAALGHKAAAKRHWQKAASFRGDFEAMAVRSYSAMTWYSATAMQRLGQAAAAKKTFAALQQYGVQLAEDQAAIDYFATSLPTMLLFDDDLQYRQETQALLLQALGEAGLGQRTAARNKLRKVLRREPSHAVASDMLELV